MAFDNNATPYSHCYIFHFKSFSSFFHRFACERASATCNEQAMCAFRLNPSTFFVRLCYVILILICFSRIITISFGCCVRLSLGKYFIAVTTRRHNAIIGMLKTEGLCVYRFERARSRTWIHCHSLAGFSTPNTFYSLHRSLRKGDRFLLRLFQFDSTRSMCAQREMKFKQCRAVAFPFHTKWTTFLDRIRLPNVWKPGEKRNGKSNT